MAEATVGLGLAFAAALFVLGLYAVVGRESLLRILLGLEIMGKGVTLSFLTAGFALGDLGRAQSIVIVVIVIEAVVVAVALALLIRLHGTIGRIDVAGIRRLSG